MDVSQHKQLRQVIYYQSSNSCRSLTTMDAYDVTNHTSTTSSYNDNNNSDTSLDMDLHGFTQHNNKILSSSAILPTRSNHYCHNNNDSSNNFGESFMMEDSFAYSGDNNESFTNCNYNENDGDAYYNSKNNLRYPQQQYNNIISAPFIKPLSSANDISTILIIEEECEDLVNDVENLPSNEGNELLQPYCDGNNIERLSWKFPNVSLNNTPEFSSSLSPSCKRY